ncbi:M48 family metalloprotease [Salinirubrum litoreum]|uniref:M48 family metalloprotease n=1 Tax=Salinirubrum litoreum TaxID=1126234 RepID=A0ABD5R8R4_9EURY|nr:M48 family metalloprotease [Salinirubrum litoreum]
MSPDAPPTTADPSTRDRHADDATDLRRRVVVTLLAVLAIDTAFVLVVTALLSPWLRPIGDALVAALGVPGTPTAVRWLAVVVPCVALFAWAQLRYTRRELLAEVDADPITAESHPALHDRVARLAQQGGTTPPTVAVADSPVPNSLTVGGLRDATLVVSTGLLETLDDERLDAVLAHELAHVRNRDAAILTLATFLPAVAGGEASFLGVLFPASWSDGARKATVVVGLLALFVVGAVVFDGPVGAGYLVGVAGLVGFSLVFGGVALGVAAAPVVTLGRRLSRARELQADRAGALLTGNPSALADALATLDASVADTPADDLRTTASIRELCLLPHGFDDAVSSEGVGDSLAGGVPVSIRSHPPTEERIARLRDVARALESGG